MRDFNEFSALWRAPLFNRSFFRDVALRWKGIGMRFLFLLVVLTWTICWIKVAIGFTHYLNTEAPNDVKSLPEITLKDGRVSSPVEQPYVFRDEHGRAMAVLDTTGRTKRPDEFGAQMLITETELIQEQTPGAIRTTPLSALPVHDLTINSVTALGWLRFMRNVILPIMFVVCCIFSLAYRLVCALIYAAIGLGLASAFHTRLSYAALLRLSMVAITPIFFVDTIFWLVSVDTGCWSWFVYPAITLGYLAFAIKSVADLNRQVPSFPVQPADAGLQGPGAAPPLPAPPPPPADPLFP